MIDIQKITCFGFFSLDLGVLLLAINILFLTITLVLKQRFLSGVIQSESFEYAMHLRKQHRHIRWVLLISYSIYNAIVFITMNQEWSIDNVIYYQKGNWYVLPLYVIIMVGTYISMYSKISVLTVDDIKDENFSLYLRGFNTDSYRNPVKESYLRFILINAIDIIIPFFPNSLRGEGSLHHLIMNRNSSVFDIMGEEDCGYIKDEWGVSHFVHKPFNELLFYKTFIRRAYEPMYAVGMTKEIMSPMGAERVYLDDNKWQDDVLYLIEKSDYIFVLVNPSDSCAWEILQCKNKCLDKTYFFIHDDEDLKNYTKRWAKTYHYA